MDIIGILKKVGAMIEGDHFVGTSGLHFDTYVNKDALLPHTESISEVGKMIAEKFKGKGIDIIVGPATGGIIISQWTAYHLTLLEGSEVLGIYTEKTPEGGQAFTRGYDKYIKGKKVLVVEDITTTGGSVMKSVEAVRGAGGELLGACVLLNKDPHEVNSEKLGIPFSALGELEVKTYRAEECPLCKSGVPINTTVGHGKKFLEGKK